MRLCVAIMLVCAALLLASCGNSRTPVPTFNRPLPPEGLRTLTYPAAGITFRAPRNWIAVSQSRPGVSVVTSGAAVVALWRFARTAPVPNDAAELARARAGLIAASRAHDSRLQLIRSRIEKLDGARAIELDVIEHIANQARRARSVHVFVDGAEIVLEEYAPTDLFHAVDHAVFSPLTRSLRISPASRG